MYKLLQYLTFITFAATGIVLFKVEKASISLFYVSILLFSIMLSFKKKLSKKKTIIEMQIIMDKIYLVILGIAISFFLNLEESKLTSILYALSWISIYILTTVLLADLDVHQFVNMLKYTLVFSIMWVLIGEYFILFKLSDIAQVFTVFSPIDEIRRPRGISSEPSYSAYISSICFLSISTLEKKKFKWFFIYFLTIVILQSSYGYMFLIIIIGGFIFRKYFTRKLFIVSLVLIILLVSISIYVSYEIGIVEIKRVFQPLEILLFEKGNFLDKIEVLKTVDSSAFFRIGPFVTYLMDVSLSDIHFYLGRGSGLSGSFFGLIFNNGEDLDLGLIPGFLYEYGMVTTIIVIAFIYQKIKVLPWEFKLMVLLFIPNASFSTQILWFSIILFLLTQKFKISKEVNRNSPFKKLPQDTKKIDSKKIQ